MEYYFVVMMSIHDIFCHNNNISSLRRGERENKIQCSVLLALARLNPCDIIHLPDGVVLDGEFSLVVAVAEPSSVARINTTINAGQSLSSHFQPL